MQCHASDKDKSSTFDPALDTLAKRKMAATGKAGCGTPLYRPNAKRHAAWSVGSAAEFPIQLGLLYRLVAATVLVGHWAQASRAWATATGIGNQCRGVAANALSLWPFVWAWQRGRQPAARRYTRGRLAAAAGGAGRRRYRTRAVVSRDADACLGTSAAPSSSSKATHTSCPLSARAARSVGAARGIVQTAHPTAQSLPAALNHPHLFMRSARSTRYY